MSISWEEIVKASQSDDVLIVLRDLVKEGFHDNIKRLDEYVKPFWNVRESLFVSEDGVVLYDVIVPKSLQAFDLEILHYAHQGMPFPFVGQILSSMLSLHLASWEECW